MKTIKFCSLLALSFLGLVGSCANAALMTSSYGSLVPGYSQNDDSYWGAFNLGFTTNFFGTNYSQIYISNNGLVTFGSGTGAFSSSPINIQNTSPMITPFWTDLDTRGDPNSGAGVYLSQTATRTIVTWANMGYFSNNYTGLITFQLVLNDPNSIPVGEGDIGFFYGSMSSGSDTHNASAGFGDGLSAINPGEISYATGTTSSVTGQLNNTSTWFNLVNGTPVQNNVPEPATLALLAVGLAGLGLKRRKH